MTGSRKALFRPRFRFFSERCILVICAFLGFTSVGFCRAQSSATEACVSSKGRYDCPVSSLKSAVAAAHSFAYKAGSRDHVGANQLQAFGVSLGKSLALAGQHADITLVLTGIEGTGVNYGQMDRDLATVKVYASAPDSGTDSLVWVETLSGQPDMPWGAVVHRLLDQLHDRITK